MADIQFSDLKDMRFREASVELEQIVRKLETGDLELEDSLTYYTRGVELLSELKKRLGEAEQKVKVLMDSSTDVSEHKTDNLDASASNYLDD